MNQKLISVETTLYFIYFKSNFSFHFLGSLWDQPTQMLYKKKYELNVYIASDLYHAVAMC